jgi:hypothetical protein
MAEPVKYQPNQMVVARWRDQDKKARVVLDRGNGYVSVWFEDLNQLVTIRTINVKLLEDT